MTELFEHGTTGDRLTCETLGGDVILVERRMRNGDWELGSIKRLRRGQGRGRQARIDRFLGRNGARGKGIVPREPDVDPQEPDVDLQEPDVDPQEPPRISWRADA